MSKTSPAKNTCLNKKITMNTKSFVSCLLFILVSSQAALSQPVQGDTSYMTRITATSWMPDGKALLFTVVRHHKRDRTLPIFFKSFKYRIETKKMDTIPANLMGYTPSPSGDLIAYMKRDDKSSSSIYLYDKRTNKETLLETDTARKNSLAFSPDGTELMYNKESNGRGANATLDICIINLSSKNIRQITKSAPYKSYNPAWSPDGKKIVYYFEKGDNRDQIWLTDATGSFHKNLTNDTSTHNFFPSWLDNDHIVYSEFQDKIMVMNGDGSGRHQLEGINSYLVKYNAANGLLIYIAPQPANKILVYDWKKKTSSVLLDEAVINKIF
jgi:Tol biopolymer transport system component